MEEKLKSFVIKRKKSAVARSGGVDLVASPAATPSVTEGDEISLESLELGDGERAEIASEDDTLTVGISMPFTLIEPKAAPMAATNGDSWGIAGVGADALDENAGAGIKVAVLDTGIAANHPAFAGLNPITENFTNEVPEDINGHGTHCAGTIFGQDVNGQRIGVARGIRRPIIGKVLGAGGGDSASLYRGLTWAHEQGARIISMSLGMDFPGFRERLVQGGFNELEATSIALKGYRDNVRLFDKISEFFAFQNAIETPLIIAAGGNEASRPNYTVSVAPPAVADEILSVGALDENDLPARFSNTDPDCSAPGVDILSADHTGGLVALSGTSMATPHVAGLAAVRAAELAQGGAFAPTDLKTAILSRIVPLQSARVDVGIGKTIV